MKGGFCHLETQRLRGFLAVTFVEAQGLGGPQGGAGGEVSQPHPPPVLRSRLGHEARCRSRENGPGGAHSRKLARVQVKSFSLTPMGKVRVVNTCPVYIRPGVAVKISWCDEW